MSLQLILILVGALLTRTGSVGSAVGASVIAAGVGGLIVFGWVVFDEAEAKRRKAVANFGLTNVWPYRRRWVAFATSASIRNRNFGTGLALVLNQAIRELELWPTDWEFDLVLSRGTVRQWISNHPNVYRLVRSLSFSNPGLDLDAERQAMRALGARRFTEEFAAPPAGTLRTDSDEFENKLEGIETGDAKLKMWSRGQGAEAQFRSDDAADFQYIDDFGNDLARGMEYVLAALRAYRPPEGMPDDDVAGQG